MRERECPDPSGSHLVLCGEFHVNVSHILPESLHLTCAASEAASTTPVPPTHKTCSCLRPFARALFSLEGT